MQVVLVSLAQVLRYQSLRSASNQCNEGKRHLVRGAHSIEK